MAGAQGGSFWTTLPGLLTGCAAVITAVGTLVGVLVTIGVFHMNPGPGKLVASTTITSFGSVQVGQSSPASTVIIANQGKGDTKLEVKLEGGFAKEFYILQDTCKDGLLQANTSCQVQLAFEPIATGYKVVSLSFHPSNAEAPTALSFTGTGERPPSGPVVSFDPKNMVFGLYGKNAAQSQDMLLTIINSGTSNFTITNVAIADDLTHFSVAFDCNNKFVLAQGGACAVRVTFRVPTSSTIGSFKARAVVSVTPGSLVQSVPLTAYRGPLVIPTGLRLPN